MVGFYAYYMRWKFCDAFAAYLIDRLGEEPSDMIEQFLSWGDSNRVKELLDARICQALCAGLSCNRP